MLSMLKLLTTTLLLSSVLVANQNEKVIQRVDLELGEEINDYELVRLKIFALITNGV